MKAKDLLIERILNLHTAEEKSKYASQVWDMILLSYKKLGGFKSAVSKEELITIPGYWKLVTRDGELTSVNLYRKIPQTQTFKVYASASKTEPDQKTGLPRSTKPGLDDYTMVKKDDDKMKRSWAEVSGPAEHHAKKIGAKPIPNKYAAYLTGKEILDLNPDNYHYTRLIMGEPHEKVMYGFATMTPEQQKSLEIAGLSIQDLPQ